MSTASKHLVVTGTLAAIGLAAASPCSARATGPSYVITDLGPLGGIFSEGDAINERGQVAGRSTNAAGVVRPTLWLPEPAWGMPAGANDLGIGAGRVYGMNDAGQCVGSLDGDGGGHTGFLWDPGDGAIDLGTLGGSDTIARAINDAGLVTGESYTADPDEWWHAFLHDGDRMIDLGTLGGNRSWGHDVNALGQVVGESYVDPEHETGPTVRAYLWLPEPAYGLPAGINAIDDFSTEHRMTSWARGINDRGQTCGSVNWFNSMGQTVSQLAIWLPEADYGLSAGWTDLRGLFGQRLTAFPKDINNKGVLASRAALEPHPLTPWTAAIWTQGQWFDLQHRITGGDVEANWTLGSAQAVNDKGQIVGWGDRNGQWHGFLLTPTWLEELPSCDADIDGSLSVDLADLIAVMKSWGPCPGCLEDVDGSGAVDMGDLLLVLAVWGPCPGAEPGACCFPITGDCETMIEAECVFYNGAWSPDACGSTGCPPPPVGACCFYPSGMCEALNEFQCSVAGGDWLGADMGCDEAECPLPRQGDRIEDPFVISSLPFSDVGNSWVFDHWYDEQCAFTSDSPDVVYAYTPVEDEVLTISTCLNSAYDTKLFVYEDVEGNTVACNDDACSTPSFPEPYVAHIEALAVTPGHTYYIIVDGWGGWGGVYTLDVTSIGAGACCLPDGSCADSSPSWCGDRDGTWFPDETCESFSCPPLPRGACCLPGGACVADQTEWECVERFGGVWQGEGVSCGEADCP